MSAAIMFMFSSLNGICYAFSLQLEATPPTDSIEEIVSETTVISSPTPTPTSAPTPTPTTAPSQLIADTVVMEVMQETEETISLLEETREYFTDDDIVMMAQVIHAEAGAVYPLNRRAAIAWTVLNRIDNEYSSSCTTIASTITQPNQFAWYPGCSYTDLDYQIAEDVLTRWATEQITGEPNEGRVLPSCYMFFWGDGSQNHFNDGYGNYWDYSVEYDPYEDWA